MYQDLKPVLGSQLQLSHPIARGLIGCWLMNEGSGQRVYDLSGKGNVGTFVNHTTWKSGKFGSALAFDGTDDYVEITNSAGLSGNQAGTISAWIYPRVIDANGPPIFAVGESDDDLTLSIFWLRIVDISGVNYVQLFFREAAQSVRGGTVISANKWWHICATSNGSTWSLYVNGVKETLTVGGSNSGNWWGDLTGAPQLFQIGRIPRGTGNIGLANAIISDVQVWNRDLSALEIAQLYREPFAMFEKPRLWWMVGGVLYEESIDVILEMEGSLVPLITIPLSCLVEMESQTITSLKIPLISLVEVETELSISLKTPLSALIEIEANAPTTIKLILSALIETKAYAVYQRDVRASIEALIEIGVDVNVLLKTLISCLVEMEAVGTYKVEVYIEILALISAITELINKTSAITETISKTSEITKLLELESAI